MDVMLEVMLFEVIRRDDIAVLRLKAPEKIGATKRITGRTKARMLAFALALIVYERRDWSKIYGQCVQEERVDLDRPSCTRGDVN